MEFARIESFAIIRKRQSGVINNFVISDVIEFARIESFAIIRKRQSGVINRIKSFYNNSKKKSGVIICTLLIIRVFNPKTYKYSRSVSSVRIITD